MLIHWDKVLRGLKLEVVREWRLKSCDTQGRRQRVSIGTSNQETSLQLCYLFLFFLYIDRAEGSATRLECRGIGRRESQLRHLRAQRVSPATVSYVNDECTHRITSVEVQNVTGWTTRCNGMSGRSNLSLFLKRLGSGWGSRRGAPRPKWTRNLGWDEPHRWGSPTGVALPGPSL